GSAGRAECIGLSIGCRSLPLPIPRKEHAMTTAVEDILAAVRSLTPSEQIEVLRGLAESLAGIVSPLETAAAEFWAPRTLAALAAEHALPLVTDIRALALPDWPADESVDDVIAAVRAQRRADRGA